MFRQLSPPVPALDLHVFCQPRHSHLPDSPLTILAHVPVLNLAHHSQLFATGSKGKQTCNGGIGRLVANKFFNLCQGVAGC